MTTVTLEEAQTRLPELIEHLTPGDPVVITSNGHPVAQIGTVAAAPPHPRFGSCRGKLIILKEDDEHLKDFAEYMP